MKPKTMILMVVAVACGLGASYMTSKLLADRRPEAPEEEKVPVLVAKVRVPGWTPIKEPEKFFEVKMLPESAVSKKSLKSFEEIKGQRLNKPLEMERTAMQDDLLTKEQQTLADSLAPGMRAIAVRVNPESVAGGFVLQGTRVDVICTTRSSDATSRVVLQNMLVLAVDTNSDRNPEQKSILGQTVTVAATPEEAVRLALASSIGELRLLPKAQGDNKQGKMVVAKIADLSKAPSNADEGDKSESGSSAAVVKTPLPEVGEIKTPVPAQPPEPAEKPRRKFVQTLINGTNKEKAVFIEGQTEDDDAPPTPRADRPVVAPEVKKDKAPGNLPEPPSGSLKTSRTRR